MKSFSAVAVVTGWALAGLAGCANGNGVQDPMNVELMTDQRLDQGLVILLPGIEGEGPLSYGVREGLVAGGVGSALPIYQWGRPVPLLGPILNQTDVLGNRAVAERIGQMIAQYQDTHPERPVYLVGHSGGGGVAVFTAEALPAGRQIEGLILLSASISSGYDLSSALAKCRKGIVNFYSTGDVAFLVIGTSVAGNVDGVRGPAAGAVGFEKKPDRLWQVEWKPEMAASGNFGGHMDTASSAFVQQYVAPWIRQSSWPAKAASGAAVTSR